MTHNQLMTGAAIGFALFAVVYITRTPAKAAGTNVQPGQRARDIGLVGWFDTIAAQNQEFSLGLSYSLDHFTSRMG